MAEKNTWKFKFNKVLDFFRSDSSHGALSPAKDIENIVSTYNNIVQSKIQRDFLIMKTYIDPEFTTSGKKYTDTLYAKYMKVLRNQFGRYYRYLTYIQMVEFTPELESALSTYVDYISNTIGSDDLESFFFKPVSNYLIDFDSNILSELTKKLYLLSFDWGLDKITLRKIIKYLLKFGDCFIGIKWRNELKFEKGIDSIKVVAPYLVRPVFSVEGELLGYNLEKESSFMTFVKQSNFASDSATSATPSFELTYNSNKDIYTAGQNDYVDIIGDENVNPDIMFTPMEMLHLTINEDEYAPFGTSILDKVRRVWKQMIMLEDLLLLFRLTRGIQRRVYFIDVGKGKTPAQAMEEVELLKNSIKRKPLVDPVSGHVDLGADLMDITDDIWIPINRADSQTKIEHLEAQDSKGFVEDIKYFQDKIFAGLRVPKAFLSYEEDINAKATLTVEDQNFARIVESLSEEIENQITRIFQLHAYQVNDDLLLLMNFKLSRAINLFEKERLDMLSTRLNIASSMKEFAPMEYIQSEILKLPQEVIDKYKKENERNEENIEHEEGDHFGGGEISHHTTFSSSNRIPDEEEEENNFDLEEELPFEEEGGNELENNEEISNEEIPNE